MFPQHRAEIVAVASSMIRSTTTTTKVIRNKNLYYCLHRRPYCYYFCRQILYRSSVVTGTISNNISNIHLTSSSTSIPSSKASFSHSSPFLAKSIRRSSIPPSPGGLLDWYNSSWRKQQRFQQHDNYHQMRWNSSFSNNNNNNDYEKSLPPISSSSASTTTTNNSNNVQNNKFVVSILGPPNAGKSTLFNRLQCKTRNKTYKLGSNKKRLQGRVASKYVSKGNAIVSPLAGTTRDRRQCYGRIGGTEFVLMDTAGVDGDRINLLSGSSNNKASKKYAVEKAMMIQTLQAAKESDLILLMWDAKVGITQDLAATARWLRKLGKTKATIATDGNNNNNNTSQSKVAILANKLEGDSWVYDGSPILENIDEVKRLGLGDPIIISALQGDGMADIAILIEQIKSEKKQKLQQQHLDNDDLTNTGSTSSDTTTDITTTTKPLQLAVLGRQNVGKSTLVNCLLQDQRVLTGPTPGLTRDAIAVEWVWTNYHDEKNKSHGDEDDDEDSDYNNHQQQQQPQQIPVQLVDTAGIRKLTKRLDDTIEDMAVADALRAMKVAEVAVLVLDAEALYIQRQELAICNAIYEEGRAIVIAANKMDLLEMSSEEYTPEDFATAVREQIEERIPILRNIPVVPMSCLSGYGVSDLLPVVKDARDRWSRTVPTGLLNRWLREVVQGAPLPVVGGVPTKLKYIIQTKGRPPTFIIFSNVSPLPETYLRFLTRHFQDSFQFFGMPVRMIVQQSSKSNPYDDNKGANKRRGGSGLGGKEARRKRKVKEFIAKSRRKKKDDW